MTRLIDANLEMKGTRTMKYTISSLKLLSLCLLPLGMMACKVDPSGLNTKPYKPPVPGPWPQTIITLGSDQCVATGYDVHSTTDQVIVGTLDNTPKEKYEFNTGEGFRIYWNFCNYSAQPSALFSDGQSLISRREFPDPLLGRLFIFNHI